MSDLLSSGDLADISAAMQDLHDTFWKQTVTLNKRTTTQNNFGEGKSISTTPHDLVGLFRFSPGLGGRYHNVDTTDRGREEHDSWVVFFFQSDLDAASLTIDAEADTVTINGVEYEIRMATAVAFFSTLGNILFKCDLYNKNRTGAV